MTVVKIESKNGVTRHCDEFMLMCAWMELCGNIGHYTDFRVNYDGDGPAHLRFSFLGSDQILYEGMKKQLIEEYNKAHAEPNVFAFD